MLTIVQGQHDQTVITMVQGGSEPGLGAGIGLQVLDRHHLVAAQCPSDRPAAHGLVVGPAERNILQRACAHACPGDGQYRLFDIVLGIADPGHAISTDVDGNAADLIQQALLVCRVDHGFVAGASHAQSAVEASQFKFGVIAAGEVGHAADHAEGTPAAVADHRPAIQHVGIVAVLALEAVFGRPVGPAVVDYLADAFQYPAMVVGVEMPSPRAAVEGQVGRHMAECALHAFVPPDAVQKQVPVPDGIGDDACDGLETCLAFVQCLQDPFAFGDIALHRHEVRMPAGRIGDRDDVEIEPDGFARLGVVDEFAAYRLSGFQCGTDAVELVAVGQGTLQETRRFPQYFFASIASEPFERIIDEHDAWSRFVAGIGLRDKHDIVQAGNARLQQRKLLEAAVLVGKRMRWGVHDVETRHGFLAWRRRIRMRNIVAGVGSIQSVRAWRVRASAYA